MKEAIITSSILIICIALIRRLCRGKISACLQYALWLVVAVRLIVPGISALVPNLLPESGFSIMNVAEKVESGAQEYIQPPERIGQLNIPIGNLPFINITNEDGPTAVFVAGNVGMAWIDFFKGIWYAGMVIVGIWIAAVNILFAYKLHKNRIKYEKEGYGLPIYYAKDLASPCLYGLPGKQAVYIPEEAAEDEEKVKHILAHEYCHYKHRDVLWAGLRCVLTAVYWFNPFVWLAAVLSKQDCELACDEAAIKMLGEDERIAYGKTLLSLIIKRTKASDIVCAATTMTGGSKGIKERIKRIAEKPHRLAIILLPVLVAVGVVIAFTFTQAKEYPEGALTFDGKGEQTVITDCFQLTFPETVAEKIYCIKESDTNVIIYHKGYGREIGRFCRLTYEEAVGLADEREVILIGNYGKNWALKNHIEGIDENISVSEHHYYVNEAVDGPGVAGTDSNEDSSTYMLDDDINKSSNVAAENVYEPSGSSEHIPAPEEVDSEIINLPYDKNEDYTGTKIAGNEESISSHNYTPNEVGNGTADDSESENVSNDYDYLPNENISDMEDGEVQYYTEHIYIPNEVTVSYQPTENENTDDTKNVHDMENSTIVLPEEKITKVEILQEDFCYIYVPADNSDAKQGIREALEELNQELAGLSDSVIVLFMSMESMEEILDSLIEDRIPHIGNTVAASSIAQTLPPPPGLSYNSLRFTDAEPYSVTLHYRLLPDYIKETGRNTLFLDAVLMFSLIEDLEYCNFQMNEDVDKIKSSAFIPEDFQSVTLGYERAEMEELFGELYPCSETKEGFAELYNRVLEYLNVDEN